MKKIIVIIVLILLVQMTSINVESNHNVNTRILDQSISASPTTDMPGSINHDVHYILPVLRRFSVGSDGVDVDPIIYYANNPRCWIVIYNTNNNESIQWAQWYQQQRNIPSKNMLGLHMSNEEHLLDMDMAQEQIFYPVQNYLDDEPYLKSMLIGFIVGYGVPGHYGEPPILPNTGGYSIASGLSCLYSDCPHEFNPDNPNADGDILPSDRICRETMTEDRYMTARIDAPTLDDAKQITIRAKNIENSFSIDGYVWYDYTDSIFEPSGEWGWLKIAVEDPLLADVPWMEFDADTQQTPNDSFRFGAHDVNGWDDERLRGEPDGPRVLAYNYNSWGATTVRSLTDEGGRYVPNAIDAGYASSIGSTGEPQCCLGPCPGTIIAGLLEGWTLGESFYLSVCYQNWMWELHGDPFMTIPIFS